MCVITIHDEHRPTEEQVKKCYDHNPSGGGAAWRGLAQDGLTPVVKWKKGLYLEEMVEFAATLPLPYVLHYRIPSCGGAHDELCHPFPVDKLTNLDLEGETTEYVLFHNGHWGRWKEELLSRVGGDRRLPPGYWSDSRAMAWLAAHYGLGVLDLIGEKTVAFGPTDTEITQGNGWKHIGPKDAKLFWASNDSWEFGSGSRHAHRHTRAAETFPYEDDYNEYGFVGGGVTSPYTTPPASMIPGETSKRESRGTPEAESFRPGHHEVPGRDNFQKAVEESAAAIRRRAEDRQALRVEEGKTSRYPPLTIIAPSAADQEALRWAKRLNPKAVRRGGSVEVECHHVGPLVM